VAVALVVLAPPGATVNAQVPSGADAPARVRGAHENVRNPEETFTDDLDLTVPGTPIDHPARVYPATEEFPTGPALGERLPDFILPNQRASGSTSTRTGRDGGRSSPSSARPCGDRTA
jgi:hypothetical protein